MGIWGHEPFENDAAADFIVDVEDSETPELEVRRILDIAHTADELETDAAARLVAAGALIATALDIVSYDEATDAAGRLGGDMEELASIAAEALDRVVEESSALADSWAEIDEYETWLASVATVRDALQT